MPLFKTKGEPRFFGGGNSAEEELNALRELRPRVAMADQDRIARDIRALEAGIRGEERVRFELANSHMPLCVIQDLYLEHDGLTAQIDFLVIAPYVAVVLECKNLYGDITIDEHGSFARKAWGRTEGIYSPVTQNERHLALIRQCLLADLTGPRKLAVDHWFGDMYKSLIVLANDETVLRDAGAPKEVRKLVVRRDALIRRIRELDESGRRDGNGRRTLSDLAETSERWLGRASEHPIHVEGRYALANNGGMEEAQPTTAIAQPTDAAQENWEGSRPAAPICPRCGSPMVMRTATRGQRKGKQFWGCSTYPKCHCIINID